MAESKVEPEVVEQLLSRLSHASEQIADAVEKQTAQFDRQVKELLDHSEETTRRLVESVDKEIRAQIAGLRRQIVEAERSIEQARKAVDEYLGRPGNAMVLHRIDYTGRIGVRVF